VEPADPGPSICNETIRGVFGCRPVVFDRNVVVKPVKVKDAGLHSWNFSSPYTHIVDFHFANVDTKARGDHSSILVRRRTGQVSFYPISRKTGTVAFVKGPLWIAVGRNNVACSHRQELDRSEKGWREQSRDL